MQIVLTGAGKRFRFDWIFRNLTHTFASSNGRTAVLGPNGSGKSTLLKVLSGQLSLSKGQVAFEHEGRTVAPENVFHSVSYAAPYIELIEEFTLEEALRFHARLKPLAPGLSVDQMLDLLELPKARTKEIRFFSSGMKQRVKLALAICSASPVLLLDEPTTNLDLKAVAWFQSLLDQFAPADGPRTTILASNDPADLALCTQRLDILAFKER